MAVQSFVKGDDLKKLIDDKLINAQSVKYVLRQKGILPVCTNSEALSDLIHHHFFGSATMTQMQEVMNFEQNNLKSTVVIISPKSEQSKEDFLTSIADEFVNKGRSSNTKYTLKNIARNQTSVTLQYIYKKPQKGRIKIAETRTVTLDVTISPLEDDLQKYKVSIRHEGMSESKQFVTLLDEMIQEDSEQAVFGLKRITLASLLKAHKVDFFDDFGVYTHKEWKLTDIINVTVNKDEKSIDDENDVTTSGEIDASEPSGRLSGISSAILKGDGLRNNDFVKECMSQGFIFSSMSYKFSHKTLPITIVIDVNFKQTDLKINIVKTYQLEDDGIERLAPLPSSDQSLYIDYFQNVAYAVYSNLIEKQKDEFYKMMANSPVLPKTSCPSPERFMRSYEGEADEILVITLASKLSGTYSTAVLAKNMFEEEYPNKKVTVIDTETGSIGQGLLIVKAAQLAEEGKSLDEIVNIIESIKKDVVFYGSLETLENAIKGGRINALAGKLINALNFKVIVKIGNGEVKPCDKARGDNNSMKKVVENVCDSIQEGEVKSLAIAHANCLDKALKVKEMMLKNHDFESVMISDLGSVMGTYTSKGAILISVL